MHRTHFQKLASASFFFALGLLLSSCKGGLALFGAAGAAAGEMAITKARLAQARADSLNLVMGIQAFYDDYGHLPVIPGAGKADTDTRTSKDLINILVGLDRKQNSKGVRYLQAREAIEPRKGGLVRFDNGTNAKLLDPWGHEFFVRIDTNYDEELLEPPGDKKKRFGSTVLAWSAGPDGKTNPDPEHKDNADNVYSWK